MDDSKEIRCSAAKALIKIYCSDKAKDDDKKRILIHRSTIAKKHIDKSEFWEHACASGRDHTDNKGIGMDSPL